MNALPPTRERPYGERYRTVTLVPMGACRLNDGLARMVRLVALGIAYR